MPARVGEWRAAVHCLPCCRRLCSQHMLMLACLRVLAAQVEEWDELREQGLWFGKY